MSGSLSLLQGIFPTQEPNPGLPHCRHRRVRRLAYDPLHDRRARDVDKPVAYPLHAILVTELANDDGEEDPWLFLLEDGCADLDDIVTTTFVLSMDSKFLCRADCKGLCCRCGKDLNDGPCGCQPDADPRLAVLQQLLKK